MSAATSGFCQSAGAASVWFSGRDRSEREDAGGGVGGWDGGCMSLLGLLTCSELHLCDSCLLMLFFLGFRGRLLFSSLVDWGRSLRVSEDSSMYAKFSPKKSSSWQLGEGAVVMSGEGRRTSGRDVDTGEEREEGLGSGA